MSAPTSAPPALSLTQHIEACARHGMNGVTAGSRPNSAAYAAFVAALKSDSVLRARAQAELDAMDPRVLMKSHVDRWKKSLLENAMQGVPAP